MRKEILELRDQNKLQQQKIEDFKIGLNNNNKALAPRI